MPEPTKIPRPFADSGDKNSIPESSGALGFASWQEGFPAITGTPFAQGGVAPKRADFNGIFNALSAATVWNQQGGVYAYDATTDYEVGNVVEYSGDLYKCITANGPSSAVKAPTDATVWDAIATASGYFPLLGGNVTDGTNKLSLLPGLVEISAASPFIDFHHANSTTDYSARIINSADGLLQINITNDANVTPKTFGLYANGDITWDGKDIVTVETGIWTPVLNFIAPNTGDVTYLTQSGTYTLIGDLVYIYGTLSFKINVVPSNYVMMSGLPFVSNGESRFSLAPNRWLRTQSGSAQTYIQKVRTDNGMLTEVFWSTSEGSTNYKVAVGDTITWTFSGWYRK